MSLFVKIFPAALRWILVLTGVALCSAASAQQIIPNFLTPSFRGQAGTEFSHWNYFDYAYDLPNTADVAAAASDPTLTQTLTNTAFVTSGGNIYSIVAATGFELENNTAATITSGPSSELSNVVFQFDTLGTLIDFSSIKLVYSGGELNPANYITESRAFSGLGGYQNRTAVQWNLTGLGIKEYAITFRSLDASNSLNEILLDVSAGAYTEIIPSARSWDAGGANNKWSTAENWSGDTLASNGGNVTITAGSSMDVDGGHAVGYLTFEQEEGFAVGSTTGSTLTVNSGIVLEDGVGDVTITSKIYGGGHIFLNVAGGATLTIANEVNGAPAGGGFNAVGLSKDQAGTAFVTGNLVFNGGVNVWDGVLVLSGSNTYAGTTTVDRGQLVVAGNAFLTNGVLGTNSSPIILGSPLLAATKAAALTIDGGYTIGKNITVEGNSTSPLNPPIPNHTRLLSARNTGPSGAVFSGNISISSSASNVRLAAENADDTLYFTGNIAGGNSGAAVTIEGQGTVVFSGSNKSYSSATTVSQGTLIIASGTYSGNGAVTVSSGARLAVNGVLAGSGALNLNGTLSGAGTINRTVTTGGVLSVIEAGNSPGTLTMTSLNAASGVTFNFEMGDLVNITGALIGSMAAGGLQINFLDMENIEEGIVYTLFNYGSLSGLDASDFAILNGGLVLDQAFGNSDGWNIAGGVIQVQFSAVPEPSTYVLFALGLALAIRPVLRRKRSLS